FRGGPAGPNPESRGSPMRSAHLRFALRAPRNDGALCYSQPSLAPLEAFQILEALALVAGAAEIELLDVLIVAQLVRGAVEHDLALINDVAMACDRQRGARVLLDQQDGDAEVAIDLLDDREHLLHQERRQAHRWLVHQDHLRARHQRTADREHLLL